MGHSSANCNLGYRCVKCAGTHEPGNCPHNTASNKDTSTSTYVNCNSNHPANYRGCKYLKLAQITSSNNKKQATRRSPHNRFAQPINDVITANSTLPTQDLRDNTALHGIMDIALTRTSHRCPGLNPRLLTQPTYLLIRSLTSKKKFFLL